MGGRKGGIGSLILRDGYGKGRDEGEMREGKGEEGEGREKVRKRGIVPAP